jgi:anti-sigma factor RsiW
VDDLGPPRDDLIVSEFSVTADEVTCQQFVELITDYLEGALTTRALSRVEEHLVMCDWCVTYLEQMDATIASLAALGATRSAEPPDDALLSALRAKRDGRG